MWFHKRDAWESNKKSIKIYKYLDSWIKIHTDCWVISQPNKISHGTRKIFKDVWQKRKGHWQKDKTFPLFLFADSTEQNSELLISFERSEEEEDFVG